MREISQELQDTVSENEAIDKVYFDKQGRHYFNAHELSINGRFSNGQYDSEKDLFGAGIFSHRQVIPGVFNVDEKTEDVAKGDPKTRIVDILTRDEILNIKAKPSGDSILAKIAQLSPDELSALKAMLNGESSISALPKNETTILDEEDEDPS